MVGTNVAYNFLSFLFYFDNLWHTKSKNLDYTEGWEEKKGSQELLSKEGRIIRFRNFFSIKKTGLAALQADDGPSLAGAHSAHSAQLLLISYSNISDPVEVLLLKSESPVRPKGIAKAAPVSGCGMQETGTFDGICELYHQSVLTKTALGSLSLCRICIFPDFPKLQPAMAGCATEVGGRSLMLPPALAVFSLAHRGWRQTFGCSGLAFACHWDLRGGRCTLLKIGRDWIAA